MILVPTRRRISNLKRFFQSIKETETTSPGMLLVDGQDYMENADDYLDLEINHMPRNVINPASSNWRIFISSSESMGAKIREYTPLIKKEDWVCLLNDDHYCVTKEWDKKLVSQLNGKNFVSCADNWNVELPAGATIWSGALVRAVGYIFPSYIEHTFIDNIWQYLGTQAKCWTRDMSVVVEHRHVDKGMAEPDDTHLRMKAYFHKDGPGYLKWLREDSAQALYNIKRLQDEPRI